MFSFAFKNMLRYRSRTVVTLCVVILGSITSIVAVGFINGIDGLMMNGYVNYQTGHIRITTKAYLNNIRFRPVYENIPNVSAFCEKLRAYPKVRKVVPMFQIFGLVSLGEGSAAVQSRGIAVPFDNNTYNFPKKIVTGGIIPGSVLTGAKFAQKIGASAGSPFMVATTTTEGGLNAVKPILGGTYQYNMKLFDSQTFFIDLPLAQKLLRAPDSATEVYIHLETEDNINKLAETLRKDFPDLAVQTYFEQLGQMGQMVKLERNIARWFVLVIMFLGALAVVNSLVASIYDRINEIGMLKAVGFSDAELSMMMVSEGAIYGFIGSTVGVILGYLIMLYFIIHGVDFTALIGAGDLPVEPILYPVYSPTDLLMVYLMGLCVPAVVALIPSKHIRRITPVEALRS